MGTFDDNRRHHGDHARSPSGGSEFRLDPPAGDIGLRREVERFPFVPVDPARLAAGLLRGLQHPGLRPGAAAARARTTRRSCIGVSGGLDSTHALIVAARAMDREGRPRSDILAFTLPGFATGERTKGNAIAAGARRSASRSRRSTSRDTAELMLTDLDHPFAARRAGLRRHVRERAGRAAHRLPVPAGQPARRHRAGHRRPVRAGAGLVAPTASATRCRTTTSTRGVPKTLIQHLIRWVIVVGAVRRRGQRGAAVESWTPRSPRSWCPTARTRRCRAARPRSGPYALQDFTLFHVLRYGFRPSKIAFLAWHAWRDAERGRLAAGVPRRRATAPTTLAEIRHWLRGVRAAVLPVQPVQALGDAERARRCRPAARCRRAATGGRRRTCRPGSGWTRSPPSPPPDGESPFRDGESPSSRRRVVTSMTVRVAGIATRRRGTGDSPSRPGRARRRGGRGRRGRGPTPARGRRARRRPARPPPRRAAAGGRAPGRPPRPGRRRGGGTPPPPPRRA